MQQTVPSKSTANVTYQDTARSRVPQAVLSRSTDGSYYQRMDSRRPRISSYSPSSRSSTTRAPHRPQRPKKIVKLIWVKKGSTVGSQAVLPQTVKKSAMLSPKQTWKPKGKYLDSVNKGNGSYTLKQFEAIQILNKMLKTAYVLILISFIIDVVCDCRIEAVTIIPYTLAINFPITVQFWTTAKSRTVNNISYIDATVTGKPMTISEASIRSDLLFDDADGIDSLNNQAIFDNIQLMGKIAVTASRFNREAVVKENILDNGMVHAF
ncbi:hypothetical protein Tco_0446634 [Tanacetum coccineum]